MPVQCRAHDQLFTCAQDHLIDLISGGVMGGVTRSQLPEGSVMESMAEYTNLGTD